MNKRKCGREWSWCLHFEFLYRFEWLRAIEDNQICGPGTKTMVFQIRE
jgi:hypothetical protein